MGLLFGEKSTVQSWVYDRRIGAHGFALGLHGFLY